MQKKNHLLWKNTIGGFGFDDGVIICTTIYFLQITFTPLHIEGGGGQGIEDLDLKDQDRDLKITF